MFRNTSIYLFLVFLLSSCITNKDLDIFHTKDNSKINIVENKTIISDGDLLYVGHYNPTYVKDNPNILYGNHSEISNGGQNSVPRGHYSFIQGEMPVFFEETNCSLIPFNENPKIVVETIQNWIKSTPSNKGGVIYNKTVTFKNTSYKNKEVTLKGTYADWRYANISNVFNNKNFFVHKSLFIL